MYSQPISNNMDTLANWPGTCGAIVVALMESTHSVATEHLKIRLLPSGVYYVDYNDGEKWRQSTKQFDLAIHIGKVIDKFRRLIETTRVVAPAIEANKCLHDVPEGLIVDGFAFGPDEEEDGL